MPSKPEPKQQKRATTRHEVLCSLLEVVTRLHDRGIAHGDVSAENAILRVEGVQVEVAHAATRGFHDCDVLCLVSALKNTCCIATDAVQVKASILCRLAKLVTFLL